MDNYNYPMGADTSNAPWNQRDLEPVHVEVQVTIVLTKTMEIPVTDYTVESRGTNEDGLTVPDQYIFDDCDFERALNDNVTLPHRLADLVDKGKVSKRDIEDCKDWELETIEITEV